jgi:predicted dehydrogenase
LKILILGYSNLVKTKILPVFRRYKINYSIASKSQLIKDKFCKFKFKCYNEALNNSKADIVYISLANINHFYWAKIALKKNYHVIVDKPITLEIKQAKILINLAKKQKKLISESIFFNYNIKYKALNNLISSQNIDHININFVYPFPYKRKILISKKTGGGIIFDTLPYVAAIARIYIKTDASKVYKIIKENNNSLPTKCSLLFKFKNCTMSCYLSFGIEYDNEVTFFSKNMKVKINRAFSVPSNTNMTIKYYHLNSKYEKKFVTDNSFKNFYFEVLKNIKNNKLNIYHTSILKDAQFKDKILKNNL